jgi:hypothetical protein
MAGLVTHFNEQIKDIRSGLVFIEKADDAAGAYNTSSQWSRASIAPPEFVQYLDAAVEAGLGHLHSLSPCSSAGVIAVYTVDYGKALAFLLASDGERARLRGEPFCAKTIRCPPQTFKAFELHQRTGELGNALRAGRNRQ